MSVYSCGPETKLDSQRESLARFVQQSPLLCKRREAWTFPFQRRTHPSGYVIEMPTQVYQCSRAALTKSSKIDSKFAVRWSDLKSVYLVWLMRFSDRVKY